MQRAVNMIAVANVSGAVGLEAGQKIFGYTIDDFTALVVMGCAVLSVAISLFMACWTIRRGKK